MRITASIALIALACAATGVLAQGLSLADAQRRAVELAPQLTAASASIRAAREMARAAGQRPDPVLRLQVQNLPVTGPDRFELSTDSMTMHSAGLAQEFTRGEKLERRAERFEREAERAQAERLATIGNVQAETALAWIDRFYAERIANEVAGEREEALREIEAAQASYRGGRGSQAEVLAAQAAVVALEDRFAEAQRKVRVATENLARWVGPGAREPLAGTVNWRDLGHDMADGDPSLDDHPEIVAAAKDVDVAQASLRVAQAERTPDWSWEVMYNHRGSPYSDMVTFGVSVPLPWDRANRQDREIAARRALVDQAEAKREQLVRAHTAEVRGMVVEWKDGIARLARYEREWVPLVHSRTQASLAAYAGAKGSLADVLAARRGELEVRVQQLQLEMETARTWAKLAFLVPVELPVKGTP
jgi:outer membrane protein TolC